jgi:hypothetical protein
VLIVVYDILNKRTEKIGAVWMIISKEAIVSNSDMIKSYKECREKAEILGKIFIFKNNKTDAVMFSIAAYERVSDIIEHVENLNVQGKQKTEKMQLIKYDNLILNL